MDLPRLPALTKLVIAGEVTCSPIYSYVGAQGDWIEVDPLLVLCYLGNEIEEISALEDSKFPALQHLDLHGNKLKSTAGIKLQHLERLYLVSTLVA